MVEALHAFMPPEASERQRYRIAASSGATQGYCRGSAGLGVEQYRQRYSCRWCRVGARVGGVGGDVNSAAGGKYTASLPHPPAAAVAAAEVALLFEVHPLVIENMVGR